MEFNKIVEKYNTHPEIIRLNRALSNDLIKMLHVKGVSGSVPAFIMSKIIQTVNLPVLCVLKEKETSAYIYNDISNIIGEENVLYFPASYKRNIQYGQIDTSNQLMRTEVQNQLAQFHAENHNNYCVITYSDALIEKVITHNELKENTLKIEVGHKLSIEFITEVLHEYNFEKVDFVYEPGQFALRGSIIDVFSFSNDLPYRIDFFGDEVETIRTFNIDNQLSIDKLNSIKLVPNVQKLTNEAERTHFLDFIPDNCILWIEDTLFSFDVINDLYRKSDIDEKEKVLADGNDFLKAIKKFKIIHTSTQKKGAEEGEEFEFNTSPQPGFNKNFELLAENIHEFTEQGHEVYLLSEQEKQLVRLKEIFSNINSNLTFETIKSVVHEGFIDNDLKICCYTDHQIFDRYHKFRINRGFNKKESINLKELTNLNMGDYVVHIDHGIGKFGGLHTIDLNGKKQESIRLIFKDNDVLYVSIHALHRISKYKGKDGDAPKLYKLGTGAWQKLKQNTKKKVKDIAKDLIQLYAQRKNQKGFAYSKDTYLQQELEASFLYEDTPDQAKATDVVKSAMEADFPMDVLVCGDVGFGKTEVAIRAAFKAVTDNKQVAIMVPTTILALQHYNTFKERLGDFPCKIDYISRLRTTKQQNQTLKELTAGKVDIIIGTHRLIGKDVKFKDLGLLIIDEEQKFGVAVKEKLKTLKVNVDTLTLTATPIPRTLQFSLMGARDLSIINTPPPNRHPVITELHTFNEEIIKEGIEYEVSRGGQVFFINNRVQNIAEVEALINRLCPNVKTITAHGQMEGKVLEKIMINFINGDYDVLVATTIIESGLDIPNANTIFINNAQNFGLSDLHQLRGRVGRSNKKAFCYLLSPPISVLTPDARRRLKAIEEFSELGSGFNIAMQDLDIRGGGNLLGGEQSGFIADIGFETYQRILDEAILELKETEFKDLFAINEESEQSDTEGITTPKKTTSVKQEKFINDCTVDTDMELLFPDYYISNVSERIRLYRQLDSIEKKTDLINFRAELEDRFGKLPDETEELLEVVNLRWLAIELGFEKIILKNSLMIISFITNQESAYYQTITFGRILMYIQKTPSHFKIKETKEKLSLTIKSINNIKSAVTELEQIKEFVMEVVPQNTSV